MREEVMGQCPLKNTNTSFRIRLTWARVRLTSWLQASLQTSLSFSVGLCKREVF